MEITALEIKREIERLDFVTGKLTELPDDEFDAISKDIEEVLYLLKDIYREKAGFVYYEDYRF